MLTNAFLIIAVFHVWFTADGVKHISNVPPDCVNVTSKKLSYEAHCQGDRPSQEMRTQIEVDRQRDIERKRELAAQEERERKKVMEERAESHRVGETLKRGFVAVAQIEEINAALAITFDPYKRRKLQLSKRELLPYVNEAIPLVTEYPERVKQMRSTVTLRQLNNVIDAAK